MNPSESGLAREQKLFQRCLDTDPADCAALLDRECAEDIELRTRIERMLEFHHASGDNNSFLTLDGRDPDRIGPYRILQRLGEGGMGIVYAAEQREPVRRRVAIKVLRGGSGSREVLARFDIERQALALMNHAGIARIVDAGTTADHRPYIVMEFVAGEPITRYCERRDLSLERRLLLFTDVCDAVQHAHQRGVIHRDLKPSNILITEEDGVATAKVIDFGIAKAITQRLTDQTLETKIGSLLGTPDYMSPEQAELSPLDVDTRTDVYALGAVLYQLLTGVTPLQLAGFNKSFSDMQRLINEQVPLPPSQLLSGPLQRLVRGELDWIALKALEKQRSHRYPTAADFARDIRAYLDDETVLAGPPSRVRKFRKFARRHWMATSAVTAVLLVLTGSQVVLVQKNRELQFERDRANAETEIARSVTNFTGSLFELASPQETGKPDIGARELLDAGVQRLEQQSPAEDIEVRAALYESASKAYHGIGAHEEAERLAEIAVRLYRELGTKDAEGYAGALIELAHSKREDGHYAEAQAYGSEAVEVARASGDTALLYRARVDFADTLRKNSQLESSVEILEDLLASDSTGIPPGDYSDALSLLGRVYVAQGQFEAAEPLLRKAVAMETMTDGSLTVRGNIAKSGLAALYGISGDIERAVKLRQELVEQMTQRYGEMHLETATGLSNLGFALLDVPARLDEAEQALLKSIEIKRVTVGEDHPSILVTQVNLAWLYGHTGQWDRALDVYSEITRKREALLGPEHADTANARYGMGRALSELGEPERAEPILRQALAAVTAALGEAHWRTGAIRRTLGDALMQQKRLDEAAVELHNGYRILAAALGEAHAETVRASDSLLEFNELAKASR